MSPFKKLNLEKSLDAFEAGKRLVPGGVLGIRRPYNFVAGEYPIFVESGEGGHVVDVDGNEYIDFLAAFGPIILGYRERAVDDAVGGPGRQDESVRVRADVGGDALVRADDEGAPRLDRRVLPPVATGPVRVLAEEAQPPRHEQPHAGDATPGGKRGHSCFSRGAKNMNVPFSFPALPSPPACPQRLCLVEVRAPVARGGLRVPAPPPPQGARSCAIVVAGCNLQIGPRPSA